MGEKVLGAVLLNPPTTTGTATIRHLTAAATALGCGRLSIANMFPLATKSVDEIQTVGSDMNSWLGSRAELKRLVAESDVVVAAWGVSGLSGKVRLNMAEQVDWLVRELDAAERSVWTVGTGPRHPSRWHQYVSNKYGRAGDGSLVDRLERVLIEQSPFSLVRD